MVDCSKYFVSDKLNLRSSGAYSRFVDVKLKTYVNCMQAQMLKMQKQIVKLTTGEIIMTIVTTIHAIHQSLVFMIIPYSNKSFELF